MITPEAVGEPVKVTWYGYVPGLSNVRDHTSFRPIVGEAAEPSASVMFATTGSLFWVPIRSSQVTSCPALTCRVGGVNPPVGRTTTRALSNMKSNVELVAPFAELAMISTGRVDEFTVGATEIPMTTASWVPRKVNSLGFTVKVTPGTVDAAERVTWLPVVSNWLIVTV
jgi:hypothetical protein